MHRFYWPSVPVVIAVLAVAPAARLFKVYAFTAAISGSFTVAVIKRRYVKNLVVSTEGALDAKMTSLFFISNFVARK